MRIEKGASGLGLCLLLLGCGGDGGTGGGGRGVCPGCTPIGGGETSDFGGGSIRSCTIVDEPYNPEIGEAYGFDQKVAKVEEAFSAPLRWELTHQPTVTLPLPVDTVVEVSIEVGEPTIQRLEPINDGDYCPEVWIVAPASVEYATADGVLRGHAQGTLQVPQQGVPAVYAKGDLSEAEGTLNLGIDETQPRVGVMSFYAASYATGMRGALTPMVFYFSKEQDALAFAGGGKDGPQPSTYAPFEASWPIDNCETGNAAVVPDEPNEWLQGRTFAEVLSEAWQAPLRTQPHAGGWKNGAPTTFSFAIGIPVNICANGGPQFTFDLTANLVTSDGRVNTPISKGYFGVTAAGDFDYLLFDHSTDFVRVAEFPAVSGVADANSADRPWLQASTSIEYRWSDSGLATSGSVAVYGAPSDEQGAPFPSTEFTLEAVDCVFWSEPPSWCLPPEE